MTTPSLSSAASQSFFLRNATWIDRSKLNSQPSSFKRLFASFLTIKQFRDLFFGVNFHIKYHLTDDFINEVMIVDFNWIILCLRDYSGNQRVGVSEAYTFMNNALKELYHADGTTKDLVDAVMDCREYLRAAHDQLEHLDEFTSYLPRQV